MSCTDTSLFVEVTDELPDVVQQIPSSAQPQEIGDDRTSGRGLLLAAAYADRLEAHVLGHTKSMSATFALDVDQAR